jgi:hypothetical protein
MKAIIKEYDQAMDKKVFPMSTKIMVEPVLGIVRGRFIRFQRELLREVADKQAVAIKIVNHKQGLDDLVNFVVNSHCKSVCFVDIANISKGFLFYLRVIFELQQKGIAVFVVNDLSQPTAFRELNKHSYEELWELFQEEWQDYIETGMIRWKHYSMSGQT